MSVFLDIGVFTVILLAIIVGFKRGFVKSVLGLISNILSIVVAVFLGSSLSELIYNSFIKDSIINSISESISSNVQSSTSSVTEGVSQLPDYITYLLSVFGYNNTTVATDVNNMVESQSRNAANAVETVLAPIITAIMSFFFIIILFIIIRFIAGKLCRLICGVAKLPILSTINKIFGGVFGILNGIIIVYFLTAFVTIVIPLISGGGITYLEFDEMAKESALFSIFYENNLISSIFDFVST